MRDTREDITTPSSPETTLVLSEPVAPERNPALVYLSELAPSSRGTMRAALNMIAHVLLGVPRVYHPVERETKYGRRQRDEEWTCLYCPWGTLRFQHTAAIRAELQRRYEPTTGNRHLAALFGVLRAARKLGYLTMDEYQDARVKPLRGHTKEPGRVLTLHEIEALLQVCLADTRPIGARDTALLALLYSTGCRRSEAAHLDIADYDPATGALLIRKGKGNKDRRCYIPAGMRSFVDAWLVQRGTLPGALFGAFTKGGNLATKTDERNNQLFVPALSDRAIFYILNQRCLETQLPGFSPHDLRRTLITTLLERQVDIGTVSKIVGHSSVQTTLRYDRRGESAKAAAVDELPLPFSQQPMPNVSEQ
ncbi:MAG: site-specific integrase [Chloroflexota bacterium]|nr:site-specific integrase [Chloroflexota bacterium]